jgi:hypothetical protein
MPAELNAVKSKRAPLYQPTDVFCLYVFISSLGSPCVTINAGKVAIPARHNNNRDVLFHFHLIRLVE